MDELLQGGHECDEAELEERREAEARDALRFLEAEVREYLRSPRGQARLAFARWCREHGR